GRICADFERRFGQPLSSEDLDEFLNLARDQGFLQPGEGLGPAAGRPGGAGRGAPPPAPARPRQSLLYWRCRVFDPDRLFNWLVPKVGVLWTRAFFLLSLGCILAALVVAWANGPELVRYVPRAIRWETLALAWVTLFLVTTCHEFAHGLT